MYDSVTLINSYFGFPLLLETVSMVIMCVGAWHYAFYALYFDGDLSVNRLSTHICLQVTTYRAVFCICHYFPE
jgi:hypothetical protein